MRSGRDEDLDERADGIREAERVRLRTLVKGDMEIADPLHADDFQLSSSGYRIAP